MKTKLFEKEVVLMMCFIFLFSALTFAQEKDVVTVAGQVMGLNVANKTVVVNEKTFVWDENTLFYDEKGSPVTVDRLKTNIKVFIEATRLKIKPYTITKIYISPK